MRTLLCFINILLLIGSGAFGQEDTTAIKSPVLKEKYGLRLGGDALKLARSFYDSDYTGFEINADYRLTKKIYIAGEIGFEEKLITAPFITNTSSGSYLRGGIDYNFYQNWLEMENMIYGGFRIGASAFSQEINNFTVYDVNNLFWGQQFINEENLKFNDLTAIWTEILFGVKTQLLPNVYVGFNVQLKFMLSNTQPGNYENIHVPGFNRTYSSSKFGAGFGYNISYLIPIYKREK